MKAFFKIFLIIVILIIVSFAIMIFFSMTDEPVKPIASYAHDFIKHILGLPLVLIDDNYPFFIDKKNPSIILMIFLSITNISIQSGIILFLSKYIKKVIGGGTNR